MIQEIIANWLHMHVRLWVNHVVNVTPISLKMNVISTVACKYNGSNVEFGYEIVTHGCIQ